jgi:alpha-galactosidase
MPGGGIILAIGWPGQWASSFIRDGSAGLRIKAGQQLTHLYLKPGEEIRTPLIAMVFWQGTDVVRAQNLWRHWYIADNEPRIDGEPPPFTAEGPGEDIPELSRMLAAGIKPINCWRDAEGPPGTWWPSETGLYHAPKPGEKVPANWKEATAWWNTGTWDVDPAKYPEGFKPFTDWAHAHGLKFMLWFEPERVGNPNSWLAKNHPEWLLPAGALTYGIHPSFDPILDEGNPEALHWLINHIDSLIKSQGIDVYREDMNGAGPGPAWRKNDAPDRQGITENFYVQGHLALWDELRRRNPHLRIDSCASGGRRNDLETARRGVSIGNRSDFLFDAPAVVEGNQGQTYGMSSWLPYQGAFSPYQDPYTYRSFYLTSFGVGGDIDVKKKAYEQWRRIAPYLLGDYYPLTSYSLQRDQWIAWQFDRPDLKGGEVQAFRRPESPYESARFKLHGLEADANYEVENLDGGKETHTGIELMEKGLAITATDAPAALIFVYKQLE